MTPNPRFNLGFTPSILDIKGGINPRLNPGFGVLRFGLSSHTAAAVRYGIKVCG
jgi:hypothetical protein